MFKISHACDIFSLKDCPFSAQRVGGASNRRGVGFTIGQRVHNKSSYIQTNHYRLQHIVRVGPTYSDKRVNQIV